MPRYLSIDILRGLAIILMVQVHFAENLSPAESAYSWLYTVSILIGSFPAPLFTFVSGLSYSLWLRKQRSQERNSEDVTRITVRRGLFLFGVGIAFNFFLWLPDETFNWDVLTLIGTAFLLLAFARTLPLPVLVLLCAMILLASPLLRVVSDYPAYWEDDVYTYDFTLRDILFGFVANGYFPVFPWIIFPIAGFITGEVLFPRGGRRVAPFRPIALGLFLLGLSGLGLVFEGRLPAAVTRLYANGLSEFPASTLFVLAMIGFALLALGLLRHRVDTNESITGESHVLLILRRFSAFSLTVYLLHHMVILWPLWFYGAWLDPEDPTALWRCAMTTPMALGAAVAFLIGCYGLLIFLEKHRQWSLEASMRWICD